MLALLFEMEPRHGHEDHYFRHAAKLRPLVMAHEGLLFLERFKSQSRSNIILSHSLWRDEASIAKWRADREHHRSQLAGRFEHFWDYRIRIADVLGLFEPGAASDPSPVQKDGAGPGTSSDQFIVISRHDGVALPGSDETFGSVMNEGSCLSVEAVKNEEVGRVKAQQTQARSGVAIALLCRVCRDYGMFERAEAPQYFETVER